MPRLNKDHLLDAVELQAKAERERWKRKKITREDVLKYSRMEYDEFSTVMDGKSESERDYIRRCLLYNIEDLQELVGSEPGYNFAFGRSHVSED